MKKIISFCLWGDNLKYTVGASKNAELAKKIYPDWICRYYVGTCVKNQILFCLEEYDNVEIIVKEKSGNWESMFWRFETTYDEIGRAHV